MRNSLFPKLAFSNLRKQYRIYIPYMLACIGSIMMFYNFCQLTFDKATGGGTLGFVMGLGVIVIAIFSVIFLFYTNSFLIKRRTKEFGLYNMLGMEKKHIARVISLECLYTSLISLVTGLALGILTNKLMVLVLGKLMEFDILYGFTISPMSIIATVALFAVIFSLTLMRNLYQITRAKPIDLLQGGNVGEKEPKTKWLMAVLGVACLGTGYYISLTTKTPLAALTMFFLAVVLVIIGTYLLFTAGSIAVLKLLRKNKRYYYQTRHFTTVSGMMYRMKQNAAGLASICILSTMVLVMLSSTTSLYFGMEDALNTRYPRDIVFKADSATDADISIIEQAAQAAASQHGLEMDDVVRFHSIFAVVKEESDGSFTGKHELNYLDQLIILRMIPKQDYTRLTGGEPSLNEGECLVYFKQGLRAKDAMRLGDAELSIKQKLDKMPIENIDSQLALDHGYMVVDSAQTAIELYNHLRSERMQPATDLEYYLAFDVKCDGETKLRVSADMREILRDEGINDFSLETWEGNRQEFVMLCGGLFFLGIFLGLMFIMATVLIIYYKQISEGYDDHERFQIMQKVGMSKLEVRRTIKSQVLTVFFLPLITAAIHVAMSFPVISKLFRALNLHNDPLFALCALCSFLLFALLYTAIYLLTARSYYKIVEAKE